jgi:hypothetical protein
MEHLKQQPQIYMSELLGSIARKPTADDLWALRGAVLACEEAGHDTQLVHRVIREFYSYVSEVQSKISAQRYNELASRLDIASVGVLALQDIMVERENLGLSLLLGSFGEGLMILASRQYVKAWEQELRSVHQRAAWVLYDVWWRLSLQYRPDIPGDDRRALIDATIAPARESDLTFEERMLLLLRLFQIALLLLSAPLCDGTG